MIAKVKTKKVLALIIPVIISLTLVVSLVILPARAADPKPAIEELQQWVDDQGYNYTVAENWITRLSPEEREALCGYRPVEAPAELPGGNIRFSSHVPAAETEGAVGIPAAYDAWNLGYVTSIKNQGGCGSCWAHAACADFESDVAIGEATHYDWSEAEVIRCNIWTSVGGYDPCNGGNALMTTNYLTRYGAAHESCHNYFDTPLNCWACPLQRRVSNWRMITGSDGESQIGAIKTALMLYGPLYTTMYASGPGFSSYSGGVYEHWGTNFSDHAVLIIGWDDTQAWSTGSGAWIIKNSWDTTWGASGPHPGCAYVAYGSCNLGDDTSAICGYGTPGDIYYHDECGWWGARWGEGTTNPTAYGAARYLAIRDSTLTAVDFWAVDVNMNYEIKIFDTRNDLGGGNWGFSSQLGSTQAGTTGEMGYYSVPLITPVPLTNGEDFIVQVEFSTSTAGHYWPVPYDYYTAGWLPAHAGVATYSGESYYSIAGTTFVKSPAYDVGIRARAEAALPDLVVSKYVSAQDDFLVSYNVSNNGNAAANASTTCKYLNGVLMESQPCPPLAPGESYNGTFDPETYPEPCNGTFNVTVCADNDEVVDESNESNNCELNIVACPATLMPDLVVSKSIEFSDGNFTVSYNVSNIGNYTAFNSTTCMYLNGVLMETRPCPPLDPGGSHSGQFDPEPCLNQTFNVTVCADNDDVVDESNETNNCELNTVCNISLAAMVWNLMSLPIIPGSNITDVLAGIIGDVYIVWHYDAETETWLWYMPGNPASTLTTMEDGLAYWIWLNSPATLNVPGQEMPDPPASPPSYDVFGEAWNHVGFTSTTSMNHASYLANIAGNYSYLWGYDPVEGYFNVYPVEEHGGNMEPGHGYWLWPTDDGTIVPPT